MIPPAIYRSVAAICDGDGAVLGTGFLVSDDGLVLTARHVVAGCANNCWVHVAGTRIQAAVIEASDQLDWALLRLDVPPPGLAPVPLAKLGPVAGDVRWSTVAHAGIRGHYGGGLHGEVRADTGTELDLFCEELVEASYEAARGMSGSPCIVDGAAVGVVTNVLHRDGVMVAGHVVAIPTAAILDTTATLKDSEGMPLPWEDFFVAGLEPLAAAGRKIAAEKAGLGEVVQSARLPRQIARRIIHGGLVKVADVMTSLGALVPNSATLVKLAEALWIDPLAADHLMRRVTANQSALLATCQQWCAEQHLDRACACCEPGASRWESFHVDGIHDEPFVDRLLDAIGAELCRHWEVDDLELARELAADGRPRVAFVRCQPRRDVVERVADVFPTLRIVFLCRATSGAQVEGIEEIAPAPSAHAEHQARVEQTRTRKHFKAS